MTVPGSTPSPRKVSDVLFAAADLIEPEGAWTQGFLARSSKKRAIGPLEANAVCWCASGAIARAYGSTSAPWHYYQRVSDLIEGIIPDWNDAPERTQAEVVAKLREAGTLAREQGQCTGPRQEQVQIQEQCERCDGNGVVRP